MGYTRPKFHFSKYTLSTPKYREAEQSKVVTSGSICKTKGRTFAMKMLSAHGSSVGYVQDYSGPDSATQHLVPASCKSKLSGRFDSSK